MLTTGFTGSSGNVIVATSGPGRVVGIQLATQGTGAAILYDNASAASGTILAQIAGSGTVTQLPGWIGSGPVGVGLPYVNGLYFAVAGSGPAGALVTSPGTPNDGRPAA